MFFRRSLSISRIYLGCGVLVALCMGGPSPLSAHTMAEEAQVCPLDGFKFSALMDMSGTSFGIRLDLKPVGPTPAPWSLAVCSKDHFVLYKKEYTKDEIAHLKKYVHTPQYQALAAGNSSYFLLGKIFEYLQKDEVTLGHIFLKASWQAEGDAAKYRLYAETSLQHFKAFLSKEKPQGKEWETAELVAGELERRLERYEDAKARFTRLLGRPEFKKDIYAGILAYQLELIAKRDSAAHPLPKDDAEK